MAKDNSLYKEVSYNYPTEKPKPLPTEQKQEKDVEKWEEDANAYLKHHDIPKRVVDIRRNQEVYNSFWHNFLIIFFLISIIGFMVFAGWGIYNDKFKIG